MFCMYSAAGKAVWSRFLWPWRQKATAEAKSVRERGSASGKEIRCGAVHQVCPAETNYCTSATSQQNIVYFMPNVICHVKTLLFP